jgi:hypothetical protein
MRVFGLAQLKESAGQGPTQAWDGVMIGQMLFKKRAKAPPLPSDPTIPGPAFAVPRVSGTRGNQNYSYDVISRTALPAPPRQ